MKKVLKVFVLLVMVVALTGCMKMNVNIVVKSDASMTMEMETLMEESMLTISGQTVDEAIKAMEKEAKAKKGMESAKVTPITKTISGKKYAGISVQGTATDSATLVKEEIIDGKESLVLTLPMNTLTSGLNSSQFDPNALAAQGYTLDKMKEAGVEMNVVITMPNKATSSVGKVDGNKVTIDLLEMSMSGKYQNIVVSSAKSSGLPLGIILGGVAAVAIAIALVLILKKKKKTPEVIAEEATTMEPIVETPVGETEVVEEVKAAEEVEVVEEIKEDVIEEKADEVVETTSETVTEETTDKKFCPNCGSAVKDKTVEFCPNCGVKIKK